MCYLRYEIDIRSQMVGRRRRIGTKNAMCVREYLVVTCSATRAVHLDIFIKHHIFRELLQLVATSGRPEEVTSHSGTNFKRGKERDQITCSSNKSRADSRKCCQQGIRQNWVYCGVSESLIQVAKKILKATIGNKGPTRDGVQTSIKVEALMNSRPLTYGGADHRDEPVLKP